METVQCTQRTLKPRKMTPAQTAPGHGELSTAAKPNMEPPNDALSRAFAVGERVRVWWSSADDSWFDGAVREALRMVDVTAYCVAYDDGDVRWHHSRLRMAALAGEIGRKRRARDQSESEEGARRSHRFRVDASSS